MREFSEQRTELTSDLHTALPASKYLLPLDSSAAQEKRPRMRNLVLLKPSWGCSREIGNGDISFVAGRRGPEVFNRCICRFPVAIGANGSGNGIRTLG